MKSSTRNEVINKLYTDAQFKSLKSNSDRVSYLLEKVLNYDELKEMVQVNLEAARNKSRKSFTLAESYKDEAELCYKADRLDDALKAAHKAILYAPADKTAFLCTLYNLKSLIHYQKKQHREMLYCAEVCIDMEANLKHLKMKVQCLGLLNRYASAIELIDQMASQPHLFQKGQSGKQQLGELMDLKKRLQVDGKVANEGKLEADVEPYFTYQLEPRCKIVQSPVVGRHFVATDYIPKGTILLRERPYSLVLELSYWQRKCCACNLELKHKFFPCAYCTEPVFCDRVCFQNGWQTFHRHECGLASLARGMMTMPATHVFRIVSRMGPLEAFDVEAAKGDYSIDQYLAETSQGDVPEVEKTREEKNRAYRMASILWDHNEKHSDQSNAQHTVIAVEVAVLLDFVHGFRQKRPEHSFLVAFAAMLMTHMRRIVFNVFGWHEYNADWTVRGHVANCQCLVGSLINHSCDPNTSWEWRNGIIRFTSKRAIAKGEQITITYGPCKEMDYYKRQLRLNYYFFACRCNVCWEDAKRGDNLRCRQCDGPVVFGAALNKETQLNGKCLNCYKMYEQFEQSVAKLTTVKNSITVLTSLAKVLTSKDIFQLASKLLADLVDLSLPESEPICRAVLACSQIIERCSPFVTGAQEQAELSLLVDRALPLTIPEQLIDGQCLLSLKFWLDSLVKFAGNEQILWLSDLHAVAMKFRHRFSQAVKQLSTDQPTNDLVKQLADEVNGQLNQAMEPCQLNVAKQTSFVSPATDL